MQADKKFFDNTSGTWKQLFRVDEDCHLFEELSAEDTKNESYTMSFAVAGDAWVFFHDYFPDMFFHTRERLYNIWNNTIYLNNTKGNYGKFHDDGNFGVALPQATEGSILPEGTQWGGDPVDPIEPIPFKRQTVYPFFIDVVFRTDADILLQTVEWISTVLDEKADEHDIDDQWNTLTHITVWNSQQHTGRIELKKVFEKLKYKTNRKTKGVWSFNDFRNVVRDYGVQFLNDLFDNYTLIESTKADKSWYKQELLQDKYMIVRFEFDNSLQKQLILQDTSIQATKQIR